MASVYGKVPCKGDFISRNMNSSVEKSIHEWFQFGLSASQLSLKDNWLPLYSVAPIWHFYLSGGVLSEQSFIGVMIPSKDRVGRHFPLILLQELSEQLTSLKEFKQLGDWFISAEDVLLSALDDATNFEFFIAELARIAPPSDVNFCSNDSLPNSGDEALGQSFDAALEAMKAISNQEELVFQQAIVSKIQLFEHLLKKLSISNGVDYEQEEKQFLETCKEHVSASNEELLAVGETKMNQNIFSIQQIFQEKPFLEVSDDLCVWSSEGNETTANQLVFTNGLVTSDLFHHFLRGF